MRMMVISCSGGSSLAVKETDTKNSNPVGECGDPELEQLALPESLLHTILFILL